MFPSPHRRVRVRERVSTRNLRQALALVVAIVLGVIALAGFARNSSAQGGLIDGEAAFTHKADKTLQEARQVADEYRANLGAGRLRQQAEGIELLSRRVGIQRGPNNQITIDVAVKLASSSDDELNAAGFPVAARVGDVATLQVEVQRLPALAQLKSVRKMFASVLRHPLNDRARQTIGIDDSAGNRLVSQTGRGTLVAIIDSGIDFRHKDFTVPGSDGRQTRIKALLDMTVYEVQTPDPGWNYVLPGQSAPIGRLYTEADINNALQTAKPADQTADIVKQRDKNGHGTHVAGTAAGNGLAASNATTYRGMAPEADLIIVKASRQNDGNASFRTTDVINAIQFVHQKATELNQPLVINLSLGGHLGPHDGTNPDERAIDNLVNSNAGRAVVVAAGNEGDASIHASGIVPASGTATLELDVKGQAGFVELYYKQSDRFTVTVTRPDGVAVGPISYAVTPSSSGGRATDEFVDVFNINDDKGDTDVANDQPNAFVGFKPGAPQGVWKITLTDADAGANQSFDAWAEGAEVKFSSYVDNVNHLIASPATARGALTVGAYVTRSASLLWGSPAPFSSAGPTADGRQKPEISAPGYYLYSSRSTDITAPNFGIIGTGAEAPTDSTHYTGLAGTSMAAPVAAGGVALMFELDPTLSAAQIKNSIKSSAIPGYSSNWDRLYGFGRLDIDGALRIGGRKTYTISGHVTIDQGSPSIYLTSGSQTVASNIDSLGNYKFPNLVAGGTYTITPSVSNSGPDQYTFSPASETFTNLDGDKVVNFVISKRKFTVDGRITDVSGNGIAGIDLTSQPMGGGTKVSTDANGFYSMPNLPSGAPLAVTPASPNYTFEPDRYPFEYLSANRTFNFTARRLFQINGRVVDENGNGIPSVSVQLIGRDSMETNNNGEYSFPRLPEGQNYSLKLWARNRVFAPSGAAFTSLSANQQVNFIARSVTATHRLVGSIYDLGGQPLPNVKVELSGAQTGVQLTNSSGYYYFELNEAGRDFRLSFSHPDYSFTPDFVEFTNLSADQVTTLTAKPAIARGEIRATATQHVINEGSGTAQIQLSRTDSQFAAAVDFMTNDTAALNECSLVNGVASSRCDYATSIGTARFAAGEASKTIYIPIVDDAYLDGNETFTVTLRNPVGASLVTSNPIAITIQDNDGSGGVAPMDNVDFFIRQQYIDFLGREPDSYGLSGWRNVLNNCGTTLQPPCDRIEVSAGFFRSAEFQTRGYFVYRLYSAVGKIPLYEEFMPDLAKVSGFLSSEQLEGSKTDFVEQFITRPQFQSKYGAVTQPDAYVDALLQTLGLPNHPTRSTWITNLTNKSMSRAQVLRAAAESAEVNQKYYNEAFVIMQYFGYLRRTADASYLDWIQTMKQSNGDYRTMINGFMNSAEYRKRFGP